MLPLSNYFITLLDRSKTCPIEGIMSFLWELIDRVLDSRRRGRGFEPHWRHCIASLSKNINPSFVLVQPRKTCPFITERLLMGCKESNQTNKTNELSVGVRVHIGVGAA